MLGLCSWGVLGGSIIVVPPVLGGIIPVAITGVITAVIEVVVSVVVRSIVGTPPVVIGTKISLVKIPPITTVTWIRIPPVVEGGGVTSRTGLWDIIGIAIT